MKSSLLRYVLYYAVQFLNFLDRTFLILFQRRLQTFRKADFLKSLPCSVLKELEDPDVSEPVFLNIEGLKREHKLSAFIRYTQWGSLKRHLKVRADHRAAMLENPDIKEVPINCPVFIVGLPRTGTTLLHNLLALDPSFRTPMMWEMLNPAPTGYNPDWRNGDCHKAWVRDIELFQWITNYNFDHVHYTRPDMPEECHFLLSHSFFVYHNLLKLPALSGVAEWFYSRDESYRKRLYGLYKEQLQVLGYGHGMESRQFLLKSHLHLLSLDALLHTFPDACLIFTHRNLRDVIPSFCSLTDSVTSFYGPKDAEFGKRAMRLVAELSNRAARTFGKLVQNNNRHKNVMFLSYENLVKDPACSVEQIYEYFGFKHQGLRESVTKYMRENPKNKHGKHVYTLSEYGLNDGDIEKSCREYLDFMAEHTG